MTVIERTVVQHALTIIEPALQPGTEAHANFLVLRGILERSHGAASHAGAPRRGRRPKAAVTGEERTGAA